MPPRGRPREDCRNWPPRIAAGKHRWGAMREASVSAEADKGNRRVLRMKTIAGMSAWAQHSFNSASAEGQSAQHSFNSDNFIGNQRRSHLGINRSCNSEGVSSLSRFRRRRSVDCSSKFHRSVQHSFNSDGAALTYIRCARASDAHTHTVRLRRNSFDPSGAQAHFDLITL